MVIEATVEAMMYTGKAMMYTDPQHLCTFISLIMKLRLGVSGSETQTSGSLAPLLV